MRENKLEQHLVCEVERIGGKAPKWVSPGNRGVPDRLVILPGGRTVYVEMKAPGKPLKPLQERWAKILRKLGHEVYKIDSYDDIDRFIAEVMPDEVHPTPIPGICNTTDIGHELYRVVVGDGLGLTKRYPR